MAESCASKDSLEECVEESTVFQRVSGVVEVIQLKKRGERGRKGQSAKKGFKIAETKLASCSRSSVLCQHKNPQLN